MTTKKNRAEAKSTDSALAIDEIILRFTADYAGEFLTRDDHEYYIRDFGATILGRVESEARTIVLGEIELYVLITELSSAIRDYAEIVSHDLAEAAFDLFGDEGLVSALKDAYGMPFNPNVVVVSAIKIAPKYRGQGTGTRAMQLLLNAVAPICGLVSLKPFPTECERIHRTDPEHLKRLKQRAIKKRTQRLRKFYERLGFRLLTNEHMTFSPDRDKQPSLAKCRKLRRSFIAHL